MLINCNTNKYSNNVFWFTTISAVKDIRYMDNTIRYVHILHFGFPFCATKVDSNWWWCKGFDWKKMTWIFVGFIKTCQDNLYSPELIKPDLYNI